MSSPFDPKPESKRAIGIAAAIGVDNEGNPVTTPPKKLRYRVNRDDGTYFYVNKDMDYIDADGNVVSEPVIQKDV